MSILVDPKDVSVADYLSFLAHQESQAIHGVGHWQREVMERALGVKKSEGDALPWAKTADFRLRPKELTIWAGYRGHHKSFVTGMVAAWLAKDVRIGIASFEMPPEDTIERMIWQCAGTTDPSATYAGEWLGAMDSMIRVYDDYGVMNTEKVMAVIHHMAHDLGCGHVFIDSLMKVGIATENYSGQKEFVNQLTIAAKRYNIHIHLVAHLRKPPKRGDYGLPNSDEIAGGSDIANLANNVVICWNDKEVMELREKRRMGLPLSIEEHEKVKQRTHIFKLDKQRKGRDQICWMFWFDERSTQFVADSSGRQIPWLPNGESIQALGVRTRSVA